MMKSFFHASDSHKAMSLTLLRLVVGLIFIFHGVAKWGMWQMAPSEQLSATMLWIFRALSVIEPVTGVAMILGLYAPVAGLIFMIIMIGALYFNIAVFGKQFVSSTGGSGWAYELLIFASAIVLKKFGAGKFSLDEMMAKKKAATPTAKPMN